MSELNDSIHAAFEKFALSKGWEAKHLKRSEKNQGHYDDWGVQPEYLAFKAALTSALPEGYVVVPVDFAKFLLGEGKFNGYEFEDMHQVRVGKFWWRSDLRAMLAAAQEGE
ncbi:hypothetical protein ACVTMO_16915 [Pseudomonas segetis]